MLRSLVLPPEVAQAWTTDEIDVAIRRLERYIHDIEALQADGVQHHAPHLRHVERSIRDTILEIFGIASQEFYRHEHFTIDNGPSVIDTHVGDLGALDELRQAQFVQRIRGAIARIRGLIDSLEKQRAELVEPKAAPVQPGRGTSSRRRLRGARVTSMRRTRRARRGGKGHGRACERAVREHPRRSTSMWLIYETLRWTWTKDRRYGC